MYALLCLPACVRACVRAIGLTETRGRQINAHTLRREEEEVTVLDFTD